jgi:hypothetical protein
LKFVNVRKNMGTVKTVKLWNKMQVVKRKIDWWSWIKASYFNITKKETDSVMCVQILVFHRFVCCNYEINIMYKINFSLQTCWWRVLLTLELPYIWGKMVYTCARKFVINMFKINHSVTDSFLRRNIKFVEYQSWVHYLCAHSLLLSYLFISLLSTVNFSWRASSLYVIVPCRVDNSSCVTFISLCVHTWCLLMPSRKMC